MTLFYLLSLQLESQQQPVADYCLWLAGRQSADCRAVQFARREERKNKSEFSRRVKQLLLNLTEKIKNKSPAPFEGRQNLLFYFADRHLHLQLRV